MVNPTVPSGKHCGQPLDCVISKKVGTNYTNQLNNQQSQYSLGFLLRARQLLRSVGLPGLFLRRLVREMHRGRRGVARQHDAVGRGRSEHRGVEHGGGGGRSRGRGRSQPRGQDSAGLVRAGPGPAAAPTAGRGGSGRGCDGRMLDGCGVVAGEELSGEKKTA